ncbi:bifunctional proline dehydrogenase/L-glutamate gamma-semialdehyde dehydrogenase [Dermabacteraceae bacterium P13115]
MVNVSDPSRLPSPAEVSDLVAKWVREAAKIPAPAQAQMLADLLKDPQGLDFTVAFVDRVVRPEDRGAAGEELARIAANPPAFLPAALRGAIGAGGALAPLAPGPVVATATRVMREMVSHLVLDARDKQLGAAISRLRADGTRLNVNLLGEAVLGAREAKRRLAGVRRLLAREDVDYVSIKVSSIVDHLALWGADETIEHVVSTLTPLYLDAARAGSRKFINMDMEEYRDLSLTLDVFERLLSQPELHKLEAGIVLQAYLPDSLAAMRRLRRFAKARVEAGGAPIKVRLVKGANLAMERVDASLHGWPLATFSTKEESDAQYKRVLMDSLTPENCRYVKLGIAGHNLFDVAFAHLLGEARGVSEGVEFEMLAGMAPGQARVVRESVGNLLLYVPVVEPKEFDVAVSYLVRRLEENASPENFMSAVFDLERSEELFARERARFAASLDRALNEDAVETNRVQNRLDAAVPAADGAAFSNEPDTDMSTPANQEWARRLTARLRDPEGSGVRGLGRDVAGTVRPASVADVDALLSETLSAGKEWAALDVSERAAVLRRAADVLAERRADLLAVAADETGKALDQGDPEVSEAIDFARFYAESAEKLAARDDIAFAPRGLTLVTPPWNFPLAIPTGGVLAALVTGSAVVFKPAPQAMRCGSVIAEALWDAGVPREVLRLVDVPENEVGKALVSDERIDQIILTGAYDTAALFSSWRPGVRIMAETSGKNSIIVTPHADLDLAAKDVAYSAFGHAGQKCSAASLVILVGSVARSRRFRAQLADAVQSLHVGYPEDATVQVGPVIEAASGKLLRGLTELGEGERWLQQPQPLDESGRLWLPGVREGVKEGSEFHLTEYFGPILGIIEADTLEDALRIQNGTDYGLTAGLQSLDPREIDYWCRHVEAGNLYINRGITGAIVQRQPFGGWKRSAVGATAKAGGPNYLVHLADVKDATDLREKDARAWLQAARASDLAHAADFFAPRDVQGLHGEMNVLRYLPCPVTVRVTGGAEADEVRRVAHAARTAGAPVRFSYAEERLAVPDVPGKVEDAEAFAAALNREAGSLRVRLMGGPELPLDELVAKRPEIALFAQPVTVSGRIEMLPFLREQAVSCTVHRYGNALPHIAQIEKTLLG